SNGDLTWVIRYNGPGNGFDRAYSIVVDDSGNVYVTGESEDSSAVRHYATIKYVQVGTTLSVSTNVNWNMVSVPLTVSDYTKTTLYPTAISNAFAYEGAYVVHTTLTNGIGYWMKFSSAQTVQMSGGFKAEDAFDVVEGWNLIGSISSTVAVSTITSIPPGLVTSEFFGYNGTYQTVESIEPGKGYWVNVSAGGTLHLSSSLLAPSAGRIRIVPTSELPPPAPHEGITNVPIEFALAQNYPNPFNPATVIQYQLPVTSFVSLKVFDLLGQEVATLLDGVQDAGYKSVQWNASGVASGVYLYKLQAGTFTDVKKLILLR
ncbi:MAG TPA: T9SS type A sorting domain-containing protein, partial [Saprospiraceae bacterium]|nr:T9SS type A sorting domain-containing protein [Saprospiraceae bacterium]